MGQLYNVRNQSWRMTGKFKQHLWICLLAMLPSFCFGQQSEWTVSEEESKHENPLANDEQAWLKGKKLFNKMCWICHGNSGEGNGPGSANLNPKPKNLTDSTLQKQTDGTLFWKISNGRGAMAPYKMTLLEKERWQLVNYIRTLGTGE